MKKLLYSKVSVVGLILLIAMIVAKQMILVDGSTSSDYAGDTKLFSASLDSPGEASSQINSESFGEQLAFNYSIQDLSLVELENPKPVHHQSTNGNPEDNNLIAMTTGVNQIESPDYIIPMESNSSYGLYPFADVEKSETSPLDHGSTIMDNIFRLFPQSAN